jgi:hypothetical protein
MARSCHRPPMLAVVVIVAVLAGGCGGAREAGSNADARAHAEAHAERCDLGFNTATYNRTTTLVRHHHDHHEVGDVDFTLEEWAEVFVDEELGMTVEEVVDEIETLDIYRRHVLGGVLTPTLEPDPWRPMTDRGECEALAGELREARAAAARHPTVADAVADGYRLGDSYYAGLGVHYQNWDHLDAFEPGRPVQLLYDGTDAGSTLVGLSYVVSLTGEVPPEGFTGDNDRWHRHRSFCLDVDNGTVNLGSDVLSPDECAGLGGTFVPNTNLWMLHTWLVPGCESDWGIYSGANPRLPYVPEHADLASGCHSGKTHADPLDLDEARGGPDIG